MPTVKLDWIDNNTDETGHEIYRSTSSIDPITPGSLLITLGANVTTYNDTTAVDDTTYFYRVAAIRNSDKAFSSQIQVDVSGSNVLWTPAEITTSLWLDADDLSTIQLNGSNVVQWSDKSGNNRHAIQSTAANQPTYNNSGFNLKPTIDWGIEANTKSLISTSIYNPSRIYGVAKYEGVDPFIGFVGLVSFIGDISSGVDLFITNNSGTNWYGGQKVFLNGNNTSSSNALPTISSPFIFGTDTTLNTNREFTYIGGDRNLTSRSWKGKISEIIMIPTVPTSTEKLLLEGYLAHKWQLTSNLPSDHPYKVNPPIV